VKTVTVYGGSDDLIEIDGDIREEFNVYLDNENHKVCLAFSDGTLLSVDYDKDGIWRFNRLVAGTAGYEKREGTDTDTDYTDRVTLAGEIAWVVCGSDYIKGAK
jgi:hypothetical protein